MPIRFLHQLRKDSAARSQAKRAEKLLVKARALQRAGQSASAADAYRAVLEIDADHWESLTALAAIALQSGELEQAVRFYDALIIRAPDQAQLYYKRANAFSGLARWDLAVADYDRTIARQADHANAYCNRGAALAALLKWEEALASYDCATALNPCDQLAYFNRAAVLRELKRLDESLLSYDAAIALKQDYPEAYINRGNLLQELHRYADAVASYDLAIECHRSFPEAFHGRGLAMYKLGRYDDALRSYDLAITLKSDYIDALVNRGNVLQELGRHQEAIASYDLALTSAPRFANAHQGRANSLASMKQFEAAIDAYDKASQSEGEHKYLVGLRRHTQMLICDWRNLDADLDYISRALLERRPVSAAHPVLALLDSPPLHRLAAEIWVDDNCPPDDSLGVVQQIPRGDKIRIGYFSADFRFHPVALLTAELFEAHDRSRFEVIAFAFGPRPRDEMTDQLERVFDRFIEVRERTDVQIAELARDIGIDIAIDLGGFTEYCRTKIFAFRAAPVQISYIGYLGTMGAPYIDYLVADKVIIPLEQRAHYAEKIVYLPCYQVNGSRRRMSDRVFQREELRLPSSGFIYCCFNANYKILPATFALWMRILKRVPGASLFLYVDNDAAKRNLLAAAVDSGVDPLRLAFGERLALDDYLARYRAMDLFLDTFPYNAGTTASDALWAGLPILTLQGQAFAARVAASLLTALGLPELIADSPEEYEDLAVQFALDPQRLSLIKSKLAVGIKSSRLFDTTRFARELEGAYVQIYERCQAGLAPEHIESLT